MASVAVAQIFYISVQIKKEISVISSLFNC